jgi:hypothetical protein
MRTFATRNMDESAQFPAYTVSSGEYVPLRLPSEPDLSVNPARQRQKRAPLSLRTLEL